MQRHCKASNKVFEISREELQRYAELGLEPPTLCPDERQRRRIAYRNFRTLHYRTSDANGKRILSMYGPDAPFPVYELSYWNSDNWNAHDYARGIDWQRPFFAQYADLAAVVPRFAIQNLRAENCEFSNFVFQARDCYLVFGCVDNDACLYGHIVWECEHCVDNLYLYRSQWCSHCVDCVECYDVHYALEAAQCSESYLLYDCRGCKHCFGCWNLRGKDYCLFNEQLSKADYEASLAKFFPLTWEKISYVQDLLEQKRLSECIMPERFELQTENVSGNHIYQSKGLVNCWDAKSMENCWHCYTARNGFESFDISFSAGPTRHCVDSLTLTNCERVHYSHMLVDCADCALSEFCQSSHDLFGCIGLRNASYCIFNQQYSKDDYHALRERLVGHMREHGEWGEFFPLELSPFCYNEAIVHEYYPLEKSEVLERGLRWADVHHQQAPVQLSPSESIETAENEVTKQIFSCERSGQAYRIIARELDFHRRVNLPLPRLSPDTRHELRMQLRAPRRLALSNCAHCGRALQSAYAPSSSGQLYCAKCYAEQLF